MVKSDYFSKKIPIWRDERVLKVIAQIISSLIVLVFLYWLISNFLEITQQMDKSRKLGEQFNVNATPTLVIRNSKTNKVRVLVGGDNITRPLIEKAINEVG